MTTDSGAGPNPPADLEEALWAAVDHARMVGDRYVAARLLLILSDLPEPLGAVPAHPPPHDITPARHGRNLAGRAFARRNADGCWVCAPNFMRLPRVSSASDAELNATLSTLCAPHRGHGACARNSGCATRHRCHTSMAEA